MPDYILVPLVLLGIVAVEVAALWFFLSRAAQSMVRSLGEYGDAMADLRAARRETVTGGYLTLPRDTTADDRRRVFGRWEQRVNDETPPPDPKV